jgi:hypothetical protein
MTSLLDPPLCGNTLPWVTLLVRQPPCQSKIFHESIRDGHAVIFNEWGGITGALTEPYNTNMITYAMTNNIGLGYYEGSNLYDRHALQLNDLGQALAKDYVSVPWIPFELPHS